MTDRAFDVVVIGCGIAGLSAAVAARQNGATVALLERSTIEERGGNTRYTEAFMRMKTEDAVADDFESHFAENAGGYVDPSLIDLMAQPRENWPSILKSMSLVDPNVVATFAAEAPKTVHWLKSFGVHFEMQSSPFLMQATSRIGTRGGGLALVEALAAEAERLGVEFNYETTFRDLLQNEHGAVVGVRASARGRPVTFIGDSVVLASGGFEGNPEMLAEYMGHRALNLRPIARGGYYNKGEGIRAALRIGAAPCGDFSSYHAEPIDPRSGKTEPAIFAFSYGILVNSEGERFVDEGSGSIDAVYESITRRIYEQTGGIAYLVLDAKISDVANYRKVIRSDRPPIEGQSIEELGRNLGISVTPFAATVAEFNKACTAGAFDPFAIDGLATDGTKPPKSNWARPLDKPPFQAYPVISANVFTFGGLKVNETAQVVDSDGEAIPGLYAAGEMVGLYYRVYTGATSVLKGAVFGRLAGLDAARQAAAARL